MSKLIHAAELVDAEDARAFLRDLGESIRDKPLFYKGSDIAHRVLEYLVGDRPIAELEPPIFSQRRDLGERLGFEQAFEVESLEDIGNSKLLPEGYAVTLEEVRSEEVLTERETDFMLGRLPAIRVIFVREDTVL